MVSLPLKRDPLFVHSPILFNTFIFYWHVPIILFPFLGAFLPQFPFLFSSSGIPPFLTIRLHETTQYIEVSIL
jgi:hypothetical protein